MPRRIFAFALLLILGWPGTGRAAPVLWTLSGVTFDDGGVASGSFVFDADTLEFSAIDIVSTDGLVLLGTSYGFDHPGFPNNSGNLVFVDTLPRAVGVHAINMFFRSPLTNAGGVIELGATPFSSKGIEGLCTSAGCFGVDPFRRPTAGELQGRAVPVPEPGAMLLLALGLVAARGRSK